MPKMLSGIVSLSLSESTYEGLLGKGGHRAE